MIKTELHKCIYCGQEALYQFKNGKWCCSPNMNGCPAIKEIRRQSAINQHNNLDFKAKDNQTKYPDKGEHICVYCEEYAEYKLKNGNWCCCEKYQQCPALKVKFANKRDENGKPLRDYKSWRNNLPEETKQRMISGLLNDEVKKRGAKTRRDLYNSGELQGSFKDRKHKPETIEKIRISTVKYLEDIKKIGGAKFSKTACTYIDKLNESMGWNLQHGMNGGEIIIGGYYLDGFDKELNIAFEYDEPAHYIDIEKNKLRKKDIQRMNYIHEKLNCRFFRYNEKLDLFYEVKF